MIEIAAISYNAQPAQGELRAVFGDDGGTLGRGPDNRLVLPDPARHVSRVQARIRSDGVRFWIANVSEANPVFVNDNEVPSGSERAIVVGDEIRVGLYVLAVRQPTGPAIVVQPLPATPVASPPSSQPPVAPAAPIALGGSVDELIGSGPGANPFADLLGGASPPAGPAFDLAVRPAPAAPPPPPAMPATSAPPLTPVTAVDPLASILPAAGTAAPPSGDPFADLLQPATPRGASSLREPEAPKAFSGGLIPEDFDPFAVPSAARNTDDPLKELAKIDLDLPDVPDAGPDSLVDFALDAKPDPNDALRSGTPSLVDPLQAVDPLKLFGNDDRLVAGPAELAPGTSPMRDDQAELAAFFAPPRVVEEQPSQPRAVPPPPPARAAPPTELRVAPSPPRVAPAAPPAPAHAAAPPRATASHPTPHANATATARAPRDELALPAPGATAEPATLLAAFLEGAHATNVPIPGGMTPELMRQLGALFYQAVAGAMALIAARQITKREIGAEMTMIVSAGNNPLKFLPTPEAAITQMIGPRMPGFMSPEAAMRNAFDDLSAHEVGVIAGTRAAFGEVLRRFDPAQLEERLGKGRRLDAVFPLARRAKLWSLYEERFQQIRNEAQDEFDSLFGEAFTKAYEEEVARQRSQRSKG